MALVTFTVPTKTYQTGTSVIAAVPVPAGATSLNLTLDVTNWTNPATIVDIAMEFSTDNQVTWQPGGWSPFQCRADGTFRSPQGTILTEAKARFGWPSNVTHARGQIIISGASVRTGGVVEII